MAYNNKVERNDVKTLEVEQKIVDEIFDGVRAGSTVLPLMRRLPDMTSSTATISVLDTLPDAYWVDGDEGLKQTTKAKWKGKKITAEEIAVIVPISQNVLDDSSYDIFAEVKPLIIEQFYKKIDQAILLGGSYAPASFRAGLIPSITTAGHVVTSSGNTYDDISDAMSLVEADGYEATGIIGGIALKGEFRKGLKDSTGQPLANSEVTELPRAYAKNGAWDSTYTLITGDFQEAVYAVRKDFKFEVFTEGCITDADGKVIYNLMQNDMVALRCTLRIGWELPNPATALNGTEATRLPFAAVKPE